MMQQGVLYPTLNLETVAPDCEGIAHLTKNLERPVRVLVKNSFAFGGIRVPYWCAKPCDAAPLRWEPTMTKDDIIAMTNQVFADAFEVDPADCSPASHIFNDLGLDSLDTVDLIVACRRSSAWQIRDDERVGRDPHARRRVRFHLDDQAGRVGWIVRPFPMMKRLTLLLLTPRSTPCSSFIPRSPFPCSSPEGGRASRWGRRTAPRCGASAARSVGTARALSTSCPGP